MKVVIRCISIFLAIALLTPIYTVLATTVQSQKDDSLTKEKILAITAEAFPEYTERILGEPDPSVINALRSGNAGHVIFSETRQISKNRGVTYIAYSSGYEIYIVFETKYTVESVQSNGALVRKTIDFTITPNYGQIIAQWQDIDCVFAFNDYDNITSVGYNPYPSSASYALYITSRKLAENAAGPAYINFHGFINVWLSDHEVAQIAFDVRAEVGNDRFTVSHSNMHPLN